MKIVSTLLGALAMTIVTGSIVSAAPCTTGTTTDSTGKTNADDVTSNVDGKSTVKVSPGGTSESPGTVGAMSNVGSNSMPVAGEAKPAVGKVIKPGDDDC